MLAIRRWSPSPSRPARIEVRGWPDGRRAARRPARGTSARAAIAPRRCLRGRRPRARRPRRRPTRTRRGATPSSPAGARVHREPRPYQTEALAAWRAQRGRGVVVLPTGAGQEPRRAPRDRRQAAQHARRRADARPRAPVVRPARGDVRRPDRPRRRRRARRAARSPSRRTTRRSCTWSTSARASASSSSTSAITCPSAGYALAARACLAPFRLGLTATPERADGRDAELASLIGPVVYRKDIIELSGRLPGRVRHRARVDRALARGARRARRRARDLPRLRARAAASA